MSKRKNFKTGETKMSYPERRIVVLNLIDLMPGCRGTEPSLITGYVDATKMNASGLFPARRCPQLGKDLTAMCEEGLLTKTTIGNSKWERETYNLPSYSNCYTVSCEGYLLLNSHMLDS